MPRIVPSAATKPTKPSDLSPIWFWLGIGIVFVGSLVLRFWGLSRFNTLVFDEVYYARFAAHFLKQEPIFTGHPPLSTYVIALGIWLAEHLPWSVEGAKNGLSGLYLSPFSYRWLNALSGSLIPLLVAGIAYQLSHRRSYALVAAVLMAADGLYLVESRYALNNIYLVIFGLLGNLCFLQALQSQVWGQWLWLGLAGVGFGASAAIKWNGLGFLLAAYGVWIAGWISQWLQTFLHRSPRSAESNALPDAAEDGAKSLVQTIDSRSSLLDLSLLRFPLNRLRQLHLGHILVCFALLPALTYYLSWIPYVQLTPGSSVWELQLQTFNYHQRVGGLDAHPYCSLWYTWPLMLRPIAYFYQASHGIDEPVPVIGPPTPPSTGVVIYDVHAMGNPFLWWFSTAAILVIGSAFVQYLWRWLTRLRQMRSVVGDWSVTTTFSTSGWLVLYLLINWSANLLPWMRVTRCVFIYHYMVSLVFAILALAYLVDRWLFHKHYTYRFMAMGIIALVLIALAFWLPLYLGLPLSPAELNLRRWFNSWI